MFSLGILEVLRRAQWVLLRVENETFNNFERYRAIVAVPEYVDVEDKRFH